jgi:hypothetical protein
MPILVGETGQFHSENPLSNSFIPLFPQDFGVLRGFTARQSQARGVFAFDARDSGTNQSDFSVLLLV